MVKAVQRFGSVKFSNTSSTKLAKLGAMNQRSLRVEEGRVLLPAQVRDKLGLHDGDELLLTLEGNRLILESEAALLEHLYQAVGTATASTLASDELIQERREEAARE